MTWRHPHQHPVEPEPTGRPRREHFKRPHKARPVEAPQEATEAPRRRFDLDLPTVESRFLPSFREPLIDKPGLSLTDQGIVYLIEPDGTRINLSDFVDGPTGGFAGWIADSNDPANVSVATDDDGNGSLTFTNGGLALILTGSLDGTDPGFFAGTFDGPSVYAFSDLGFFSQPTGPIAYDANASSGATTAFSSFGGFEYPVSLSDDDDNSNVKWNNAEWNDFSGRLYQKTNGETVWSTNVNEGDVIDNSGWGAFKFAAYPPGDVVTFQTSPSGHSNWAGATSASIDIPTGEWTFASFLTASQSLAVYAVPSNDSLHAFYDDGNPALRVGSAEGGTAVFLRDSSEDAFTVSYEDANFFIATAGEISFFGVDPVAQQDATDGSSLVAALIAYGLLDSGSSWSGGGGGLPTGWTEDDSNPANVAGTTGSLTFDDGTQAATISSTRVIVDSDEGNESYEMGIGAGVVSEAATDVTCFTAQGGAGATVALDAGGLDLTHLGALRAQNGGVFKVVTGSGHSVWITDVLAEADSGNGIFWNPSNSDDGEQRASIVTGAGNVSLLVNDQGMTTLAPVISSGSDALVAQYDDGNDVLAVGTNAAGVHVRLAAGIGDHFYASDDTGAIIANFQAATGGNKISFFDVPAVIQQDATDGDSLVAALIAYGLLDSGSSWSGGGGSWPTYSGSGSPVGVVAPAAKGDTYADTTNGAIYLAVGTSNTDWTQVAGALGGAPSTAGIISTNQNVIILADTGDGEVSISDVAAATGTGNQLTWGVGAGGDGNQTLSLTLGSSGQFAHFWAADGSYTTPGPVNISPSGDGGAQLLTVSAPAGFAEFLARITTSADHGFFVRPDGGVVISTDDDGVIALAVESAGVGNSVAFQVSQDGSVNIAPGASTSVGFFGTTGVAQQAAPSSAQDIANALAAYGLLVGAGTVPTGAVFTGWTQDASDPANVSSNGGTLNLGDGGPTSTALTLVADASQTANVLLASYGDVTIATLGPNEIVSESTTGAWLDMIDPNPGVSAGAGFGAVSGDAAFFFGVYDGAPLVYAPGALLAGGFAGFGVFDSGGVTQQDATDGPSLVAALKAYGLLDTASSWSGGDGLTGDGSPVGVVAATSIGQQYTDTTNGTLWLSTAADDVHWISIGGAVTEGATAGIQLVNTGVEPNGSVWVVLDSAAGPGLYVEDSSTNSTGSSIVATHNNTLDDGITGAATFNGYVTAPGLPEIQAYYVPFDAAGLSDGSGFPLFTPAAGSFILDVWIEMVTAWDGTTPFIDVADATWADGSSGFGWFRFASGADQSAGSADTVGGGVLIGGPILPLASLSVVSSVRLVPNRAVSDLPILAWVTQDGTLTGADPGSTQGEAIVYVLTAPALPS